MEADTMYWQCRREHDPTRKAKLRDQLVDYNRDDLDALVAVTEEFRMLSSSLWGA
jgi:hypothetical protein